MTSDSVVSLWDSRSVNFAWLFPKTDPCDISRAVCEFPQTPEVIFKRILAHLSSTEPVSCIMSVHREFTGPTGR